METPWKHIETHRKIETGDDGKKVQMMEEQRATMKNKGLEC